MSWSLIEVEALAKKAAKGAGYSWGEAEDAARAVRWLEARGLGGAAALAAHLTGGGKGSCPIWKGIAVSDGVEDATTVDPDTLDQPLLFLPFADWAGAGQETAQRMGITICNAQVRSYTDTGTMNVLGKFAHKTYAPSTEESRALGAGAGLSDND